MGYSPYRVIKRSTQLSNKHFDLREVGRGGRDCLFENLHKEEHCAETGVSKMNRSFSRWTVLEGTSVCKGDKQLILEVAYSQEVENLVYCLF